MKFFIMGLVILFSQFLMAETFVVDVTSNTNFTYKLQLGYYGSVTNPELVKENYRKQVEDLAKTMSTYSFLRKREQIMENIQTILNKHIEGTKIQGMSIIRLKPIGGGKYDFE